MVDREVRPFKEWLLDWRGWTANLAFVGVYMGGALAVMTFTALILGISPLGWASSRFSTNVFFVGLMTGLFALQFLRLGNKIADRIRVKKDVD